MKILIACAALASLLFGCAAEVDSPIGQDETELRSSAPAPAVEVGEATSAAAVTGCDANPIPCTKFCQCQFAECIASGGIYRLCRLEADGCYQDCRP